jgi:HK97 family phage portal protein
MRIFGLEITRSKALHTVPTGGRNWWGGWGLIKEWEPGSWQRNDEIRQKDLLCYPTLYACLNRISQDVGKLPFLLKQVNADDIWQTVENPAYSPVLRKPNVYQTAQQFREAWILSKLIHGNTYVLKGRDNRGVVDRLYVLDPHRVVPLVSDSGDVFYQLYTDSVQGLLSENWGGQGVIVPAREIIHDRLNTFHHQLIGVPPLCAAYWPAVKNLRILKNAEHFFANGARPGGILTAPAGISEEDGNKIKAYWDENYSGTNAGKTALIGADIKYQALGLTSSVDSQVVEQLRYGDEQICQPFGIPPFKIGIGTIPAGLGVDGINQLYYADALQGHIESMENLLDEGLSIPSNLGIWMDLEPLLRMDAQKQAEVLVKLMDGVLTPNEARKRLNYGPLEGGNTVYLQQQDIPLREAAKNTVQVAPTEAPPADDEEAPEEQARALFLALEKRLA